MTTDWKAELQAKLKTDYSSTWDEDVSIEDALSLIVRAQAEAYARAIDDCASLAEMASMQHPSCLDGVGGLKWEEYNETSKMAMHSSCQILAFEIRLLKKDLK